MSNYEASDSSTSVLGRAAQSADHAIQSTQQAANHAIDGMADSLQSLKANARQLSQRTTDSTRHYIQAEPVKAMLVAAAAGAALMALMGLLARSRRGS